MATNSTNKCTIYRRKQLWRCLLLLKRNYRKKDVFTQQACVCGESCVQDVGLGEGKETWLVGREWLYNSKQGSRGWNGKTTVNVIYNETEGNLPRRQQKRFTFVHKKWVIWGLLWCCIVTLYFRRNKRTNIYFGFPFSFDLTNNTCTGSKMVQTVVKAKFC